jgi:hypothetical protein
MILVRACFVLHGLGTYDAHIALQPGLFLSYDPNHIMAGRCRVFVLLREHRPGLLLFERRKVRSSQFVICR